MLTKAELSKKGQALTESKNAWNSDFYNCFAYTQPQRNYIWRMRGLPAGNKQIQLFTSAGTQGTQIFISRIQNRLTPFGKDWIQFRPNESVSDSYKEQLQTLLNGLSKRANELKRAINLDTVLNESYYDMVGGSSILQKNNTVNGIKFINVPLTDIELGTEQNQTSKRCFKIPLENVGIMFPELRGQKRIGTKFITEQNKCDDIELTDMTYYNEDAKYWEYYLREQDEIILTRKYKTDPFKKFHWDKAADMPFGNGIGIKANPNLRRLNAFIKTNLELLPFAFPMFIAQNNAIFDKSIEYKAGGIIRTNGDPKNVIPIRLSENVSRFQLEIDKEEQAIKSIMLDYTLPTNPRQMTAAEVYARTQPQEELISTSVFRLTSVIEEIALDLAEQVFKYEIAPTGFKMSWEDFKKLIRVDIGNGSDVDNNLIQKIQAYIGTVGQFDPQAIYQSLKRSETLVTLQHAFGLPQNITSTAEEINQATQQQAQAQAQAGAAEVEGQMAIDTNKENSKAMAEARKAEGM